MANEADAEVIEHDDSQPQIVRQSSSVIVKKPSSGEVLASSIAESQTQATQIQPNEKDEEPHAGITVMMMGGSSVTLQVPVDASGTCTVAKLREAIAVQQGSMMARAKLLLGDQVLEDDTTLPSTCFKEDCEPKLMLVRSWTLEDEFDSQTAALHERLDQVIHILDEPQTHSAESDALKLKMEDCSSRIEALQAASFTEEPVMLENGATYIGQWVEGKRHGLGKQDWPDGASFLGHWANGLAEGYGIFKHVDGDVYEGSWFEDKSHGVGIYRHSDRSVYKGHWQADQKNGFALEEWSDGHKFEGWYQDGKKHKSGRCSWPEGSTYTGQFEDGNIHGVGVYTWPDGRVFKGQWQNNKMHGQGEFTWADGRKYMGGYVDDKKEGIGLFQWPDQRSFIGGWKNGKREGQGIFRTCHGDLRQGFWHLGIRIRSKASTRKMDVDAPSLESS